MKKRLLLMAAWALMSTSAFAQVADGEYYLYDAATQSYLSRGSSWGTKAVTSKYTGLKVVWNSTEGTLTFPDNDQRLFKTNDDFVYTDNTPNSTGWTLTAKGDGYTIRYGAEGKYLGHADGSLDIALTDNEEAAIVWTFLTKEGYANTIKANELATYQSIIDACHFTFTADQFIEQVGKAFINKDMTEMVPTARFNGSKGTWTWDQVREQGGQPKYGVDYAEVWQATGSFHQTITVPSGLYRVSVNGFDRATGNAKCVTLGDAGYEPVTSAFIANNSGVALTSWYSAQTDGTNPNNTGEAVAKFNEGKYSNELYTYVGEDGQLTLTVAIPSHVGNHWVLFNNVQLTQLTELSDDDVAALLASVPEGYMQQSIEADLNAAKTALEGEKSVANYNALAAAIAAAKESISAYAEAKTGIEAAETFLKLNTFATAEAIDAYNAALTPLKEGYAAQTLTTAEAKNVKSIFNFSVSGWRSNSGVVGDLLASAWDFTRDSWDQAAYVNNWSAEGETDGTEFKVPFVEAFVNGSDLTARTLNATLSGLKPNGTYNVNIWARVETTTDEAPTAGKIMMKVGEGTAVDIAAGTKHNDTKLYLDHFTAKGNADADGNLKVSIDVAEGSNVHWLSFKNVSYAAIEPVVCFNFNDSTELEVSNESNAGDIVTSKTFTAAEGQMTLSVNRSTNTTPNRFWNTKNGNQLRVYGGSLAFEVPEGKTIKRIEINNGKWSAANAFNGVAAAKGEWEGNSNYVVMTVGGNTQINKISAIIEDADANTAAYKLTSANLNDVKALPFGKEIAITLDSAVVTLYSGKAYTMYSFMQDKSGAITADINVSNLEFFGQDKVLSGTLNAAVDYDMDLGYQLVLSENTGTSAITVAEKDSVVVPETMTVADVVKKAESLRAKYLNLKNVKYFEVLDDWGSVESAYLVNVGETKNDTIPFMDQYYVLGFGATSKIESFASINGFVCSYEGKYEFRPYGAYESVLYPAVEVANIAALKEVEDGKDVKLTLNDAKVTVYQMGHMGVTCYLEDNTGAVELVGSRGGGWSLNPEAEDLLTALGIEGDSIRIEGVLYASLTNNYGSLALSLNDSTCASEITKTENVDVAPTVLTIPAAKANLDRYNRCFVAIENVRFFEEDYQMCIYNGTDSIGVFDMYGTFYDEEGMPFTPDVTKDFNVIGILMDLGEGFGACMLPLTYEELPPATGIIDVNDREQNNEIKVWNINGVRINGDVKNLQRGIYIINGKKVVIK